MRPPFVSGLATAVALVFLGVSSPSAAQETSAFDVSAGYQAIGIKGDVDETLGKGWYADVAGNFGRYFAAVFQVGGNYKTYTESLTESGLTFTGEAELDVHQFMGGLRVKGRSGPVTPFVQFLAGGATSSADVTASFNGTSFSASDSETDFVTQVGGGVTFQLTDRVGVRAMGDYLRIWEEEEGLNGFRFAAGIVLPF
jgi:hypothetical protein